MTEVATRNQTAPGDLAVDRLFMIRCPCCVVREPTGWTVACPSVVRSRIEGGHSDRLTYGPDLAHKEAAWPETRGSLRRLTIAGLTAQTTSRFVFNLAQTGQSPSRSDRRRKRSKRLPIDRLT